MSTIYTDGAGNKYIGDCRFGNHNISYPSSNFLKSIDTRTLHTTFLADMSDIFTDAGWGYITVPSDWPTSQSANIFRASIPGENSTNKFQLITSADTYTYRLDTQVVGNFDYGAPGGNDENLYGRNFDYAICCGNKSLSILPFTYNAADYSSVGMGANSRKHFIYFGQLEDINTGFGYYNASFLTKTIVLRTSAPGAGLTIPALDAQHYIVGAKKDLLQSGDATYAVVCSDGQTPTSVWATDLYVFDNNATLGYPCIGRAPNLLLGYGTYTYLKPVEILGSVFPDGGSHWYIPVGTYAGRVLLMRCYSSMT